MVSITELVRNSEQIQLSRGLVLLLPEGSQKQGIMMEIFSGNKRFANITAAGILQLPIWRSEHDYIDERRCIVYLVAPGNWNNGYAEYFALFCGGGKAIMASLSSCGYEADRKGRWQNVRQ